MASDLEKRANQAFVDDNFQLAVDLYTEALKMEPENADIYANRAQAHIKLRNFTEAVADANKAIDLDPSLTKAYLRKGTACIKLEEYQTAKAALEEGSSLAPRDSRFINLIKECDERIAGETNGLRKVIDDAPLSNITPSLDGTTENAKDSGSTCDTSYQPTAPEQSKPKYRHAYYNCPAEVVLTIYAKGIPAEYVNIEFGEQTLSVSISIPGEEPYHFQLRLFGKIIPEKSKYQVSPTKIEIRLFKAAAITWTSLEYSNDKTLPQKIAAPSAAKSEKPSYPSSKSKKDWDKLEADGKKEEKDEKLEGDAALNKLFRDIYRDGDDDMKRAMMKSFVESNGTVLSTNWKDVGSRKVDSTPPDGMELKKW